jgi:hypothetical protein
MSIPISLIAPTYSNLPRTPTNPSEAPRYTTGIIVCMISRIAEIIVILALRFTFTIPNKRRDQLFAAGDARYDPDVTTYEDLTDKQNLHFRYLCEWLVGLALRSVLIRSQPE